MGADFSPEDYGYEGEGLVATFSCHTCGAMFEGVYLENEDPNLDEDEEYYSRVEIFFYSFLIFC